MALLLLLLIAVLIELTYLTVIVKGTRTGRLKHVGPRCASHSLNLKPRQVAQLDSANCLICKTKAQTKK